MKRNLCLLLCIAVAVAGSSARAADHPTSSAELQKLDVSAGRWVFHGKAFDTPFSKAGEWTWNEDCRWSENRTFMVCDFSNVWSGKAVESLVVDTYNEKDGSFWHYELFKDGETGSEPFVSRMTIDGNTRIEHAEHIDHGVKTRTRITYVFDSPDHVSVKIELSRNGGRWVTVDEGEGIKQS